MELMLPSPKPAKRKGRERGREAGLVINTLPTAVHPSISADPHTNLICH
jgi:hypothetical protein